MSEYTADLTEMLLTATEPEPHIVIAADRSVLVPDDLKEIAAQFDHNIETVTFDCPRYWDGHDFSKMHVFVNYRCADGKIDSYPCDPPAVDAEDETIIHFDWTLSRNVTCAKGVISFLVCVKSSDENGVLQNQWSSRLNQEMEVLEGIECNTEEIVPDEPDVIERILNRLDALERNGGGVEVDTTLTEEGKAADAKVVGEKFAEQSKAINNKAGKTGWSPNKYLGTDASGNMVEKEAPSGSGGNGSHFSMTTIASGTYTPTSTDESATTVSADLSIDDATLEEIRKYKAVFIQFSAGSKMNANGSVSLNVADSAQRYDFCGFRYGLQSYRAMLLFTDAEHYAAIVFIQSSSENLKSKIGAQTGATSLASVGIADFSTLEDSARLLFKIANATVGNEISYQVIGLAEETANFT